jgi:hypothetical protein
MASCKLPVSLLFGRRAVKPGNPVDFRLRLDLRDGEPLLKPASRRALLPLMLRFGRRKLLSLAAGIVLDRLLFSGGLD